MLQTDRAVRWTNACTSSLHTEWTWQDFPFLGQNHHNLNLEWFQFPTVYTSLILLQPGIIKFVRWNVVTLRFRDSFLFSFCHDSHEVNGHGRKDSVFPGQFAPCPPFPLLPRDHSVFPGQFALCHPFTPLPRYYSVFPGQSAPCPPFPLCFAPHWTCWC